MSNDHIISLKRPPPPPEPPRIPEPIIREKKKRSRAGLYTVIVLILLLGGVGAAWYFDVIPKFNIGGSLPAASEVDRASKEAVEKEAGDLVAEVGALIMLPIGEVPTVATVSDPKKLEDQVFFRDAKVGDKVLIYTQAKKAYLYRPSLHLLIEVAPITTDIN